MRKLFYMGLEPYEGRYTLQLQEWSERVFKKKNIDMDKIIDVLIKVELYEKFK